MKKPSIGLKITAEGMQLFLSRYYLGLLGLILVALVYFCGLVYYQDVYLVTTIHPQPQMKKVSIDHETLQKVLDDIDHREESLQRIQAGSCRSPFE